MARFEGKVVAITGASSGIGEATARMLAGDGTKVVLRTYANGIMGNILA
jgi:NADP-dependent 3-hydroxy acid dehydrogenase YdfG